MFKFKFKKKKKKLITDETELFCYLRDCMLKIYSDEHCQEDILYAWTLGCDKIDEILEELKK